MTTTVTVTTDDPAASATTAKPALPPDPEIPPPPELAGPWCCVCLKSPWESAGLAFLLIPRRIYELKVGAENARGYDGESRSPACADCLASAVSGTDSNGEPVRLRELDPGPRPGFAF